MFNKTFKLLMSSIVSFNLVILPAFGNGIAIEERTIDKINTFLKKGNPSDIPFIDYMESFVSDSIQPLKRFDLSEYAGKKIFAGYGIYDSNQNFCKYIEMPGMPKVEDNFIKTATFNKHSYGLSASAMSYNQCVALAAKFNGTPAIITSPAENNFISSTFRENTGGVGNSRWVGSVRPNCSQEYKTAEDNIQKYFNWSSTSEIGSECNESTLNVVQNQYGTWNKKNATAISHQGASIKCLVEVDSEEISRPVKVCAPWWRIEREYKKENETVYGGVDIYKINQADIPEHFTVCTKYEEKAIKNTQDKPYRDVTCTSYYDSVIAPECIKNPRQSICYIDECQGYIKNACRLKNTIEPYKDYTKTETIQASVNVIQKGKTGILTHVYSCPPSLPSLNSCQEQSSVIIFPKECPSSDCAGYSKCIQDSTSIEEKNNCSSKYVCEKIYGNPDNVEYDAQGNLKFLKNTCSDGTVLEFEPSIQKKDSKKCLEYEYYTIEEEVSQRCVLDRPFNDYTVDTSLTEIDIYMNNPNCIRLNNVKDARPTIQININSINYGFAKTALKKGYIDGTEGEFVNIGDDEIYSGAALDPSDANRGAPSTPKEAENALKGIVKPEEQFNCSEFYSTSFTLPPVNPGSTTFPDVEDGETEGNMDGVTQKPFFTDIQKFLKPETVGTPNITVNPKFIAQENDNKLYIQFVGVNNATQCTNLKTAKGGTSNTYQEASKVCKVYVTSTALQAYNYIEGTGTYDGNEHENYILRTKSAILEKDCKTKAFCLDGSYNKFAYNNSSASQCEVNFGENYEFEEEVEPYDWVDYIPQESKTDENCIPLSSKHNYLSQLDGTSDIFAIQEVSNGSYEEFGYFSNYNTHPYKSNVVSINGKEVYPLKSIPVLDDALVYDGKFLQTSITTKKPNYTAGAIGGVAAGAAAVAYVAVSAAIAAGAATAAAALAAAKAALTMGPIGWIIAIILIVFVLVSMIFGKKTKLNEQNIDWIIYKLIPINRYVKSQADEWSAETNRLDNYKNYHNKYDHRKQPTIIGNNVKVTYASVKGFTGTMKPDKFRQKLEELYYGKLMLLTCMGWMKSDVDLIMHPVEKQILVSYPKCKTLSFSCNKKNRESFSKKQNPFYKKMNNAYMAAVNGVSIIVPYLGDYELKAYNKEDNLLSTITVKESEFMETTTNVAKHAQVMFGLGMGLADGINEGTENNACRWDLMTEWGGGTSGIYYENNNTGNHKNCQKSHDGYVRENSATKITVKPLNGDREFTIDLDKRLPFPNRVFLVTLNEKEIREYRCYDDFGDCESNQYSTNSK